MLLFLDTADMREIKKYSKLIDGVTTTPTIIKRDGMSSEAFMTKMHADFPELEVHIEALAEDAHKTELLVKEFMTKPWYRPDKVVFKIPISLDGILATKNLKSADASIRVNLHMAFSAAQSSLALRAKPDYISPLIGRYADRVTGLHGHEMRAPGNDPGFDLLKDILASSALEENTTHILASSLRTVHDFVTAVVLGAGAATLPPAVLGEALGHPLTTEGVGQFWQDLLAV